MAIDVSRTLGAVTRTLSTREVGGAPAHVLVAARSYPVPAAELWDALTSAVRIPRWFLPVSGELRQGGRYQFEGNAGGEIRVCDAPRRLELTWEWDGQVSWVNLTLADDADGGTRLELEHVAHVPPEIWARFGPGAVGVGWDSGLMGLDQHLTSATPLDPRDAMQWMASAEGRSFIRGSSEAWRAAHVAAGADASEAAAAAARTAAAYMGEAPAPVDA